MNLTPRFVAVATLMLATACAPETVVEPATPDLSIRAAKPTSPGYVAQKIAPYPGDAAVTPKGVNDLGHVVGISYPAAPVGPIGAHAFIRIGSTMHLLSTGASASAVSSGSPVYVAGDDYTSGENRITRWTFNPSTLSTSQETLDLPAVARDINDGGAIVGTSFPQAVVWPLGGDPELISAPAGFDRATGRGINNAGHVSVTFHGTASRGFLRVGTTMIELPPATGHTMSFSGDVSEPVNGIVYVTGVSASNVETGYHLARWKVDITTGTVLSVEARREISEGGGVSDAGWVAGQNEGTKASAFVWTLNGTLALKPTKGGQDAQADDMSANGRYVVGDARYGVSIGALLWTYQQ